VEVKKLKDLKMNSLAELQAEFERDGSLPQTSITRSQTPEAKPQTPEAKPQTPMVGDTKLGGLSGHSGSVAYDGQQQAPLSTAYSPLAQSDIDEQGLSIISGKGYRASTQSNHKGYDIPITKGTPVYAYLPGRITRNSPASGYGNIVEWQDDVYGEKHMFAHLMAPGPLKVGEKFSAGTMLAKTGDTGTPGSYHLHWEIGAVGAEVEPGAWTKKHPIKMTPKQTPDKAQKVSSTTSYEETGTQVAMIQVPLPVPMPSPGGGGGTSSGGSRGSGGYDIDSIILGQSFSNA
jgi:murein DD-endopeptidase MepM/ murein hydrolase activator NlpD